jgi:hypothetical protein
MMIVTADDSWAARDRAILETITCDEGIFAAGIRKAATLRPLSPETASRLVPWFSARGTPLRSRSPLRWPTASGASDG